MLHASRCDTRSVPFVSPARAFGANYKYSTVTTAHPREYTQAFACSAPTMVIETALISTFSLFHCSARAVQGQKNTVSGALIEL
jgi:hypothetical protein